MNIDKIQLVVFILRYITESHACWYNYDCSYTYGELDQCFMDATFPEMTNEGFCWGAGWTSGDCKPKKSINEHCLNAGGNADNNNCVTNFCNHKTNTCELRESGCASLSKCVTGLWSTISEGLAQFTGNNGGSEDWIDEDCDDIDSACWAEFSILADRPDLYESFYDTDYNNYYSLDGSLSVDLPDNAIKFDVNFKDFYVDFYLKDVDISIDATIGVSNNKNSPTTNVFGSMATTADSEQSEIIFQKNLDLSDPLIIYRKSLKLGKAAVELEIGMQFIGLLKGSIISDVNFIQTFKMNKHIEIPKLGAHVTTSGVDILGIDEVFDELFDIDDINIQVDGNVEVESSFQFRFGPRVYVSINGIEVYGSIDVAFEGASKFTANADSGCESGSADMSLAMFIDFASPPFSIGNGVTAVCKSAVEDAQDNYASVDDINSAGKDSYGTHCQLLMDTDDESFGLCDTVGDVVDDLLNFVTGKKLQTNSIYECGKLFQVEKQFPVSVNGQICNAESHIDIDIGCDKSRYDDVLDYSCQISVRFIIVSISIYVLCCIFRLL